MGRERILRRHRGTVSVDTGTGEDVVTFKNTAADTQPGQSPGHDPANPSTGGSIEVQTGEDNDRVEFGEKAAASLGENNVGGTIKVDTGTGDDVVTFGKEAARGRGSEGSSKGPGKGGTIDLDLGEGADQVTFGKLLGEVKGNDTRKGSVTIDLGDDTDIDVLTFEGSVGDAETTIFVVQNFDATMDKII